MKIGRNDPCPCGSGKKYKKCCMKKDEEARHAALVAEPEEEQVEEPPQLSPLAPAAPPEPTSPEPSAPRMEAINARWEAFKKEDYEGRIALFLETLDEEDLMDEDMAFEMLNEIHVGAVEHNERDRFDGLVETLRERLPKVYARNAPYFLDWRITNALTTGRFDLAAALAKELAETSGRDIDTFNNVLDRLAYHGQLSTLVGVTRIAWPKVQDASNIVSWGIDKFARRAVDYETFDYLEHHTRPDVDDPELWERLEAYKDRLETDKEKLRHYFFRLSGQTDRTWTLDDFGRGKPRKKSRRRAKKYEPDNEPSLPADPDQNLYDLGVEFLGHLRRERNVSYPRGELARAQLLDYFFKRRAGKLAPRESMLEAVIRTEQGRPKPKSPPPPKSHPLCPDPRTFERYLVGLLDFINPQHYKTAAALETVPAWLNFLASRGLLDDPERQKTLDSLRKLRDHMVQLSEKATSDPTLPRDLERAWPES